MSLPQPDLVEPFEMDLGYRLGRGVWGMGLATEGSLALIDRTLHHWGQSRVAARTLAQNLASRRVMEKCGMRLEREFTYPEDWLPGWTQEQRRAVRYVLDRT
jgi:RimJ/RimL family protein N-acetyltransferase